LANIDRWYARIEKADVLETWRRWLSTPGEAVTIRTEQGLLSGVARDVDETGALLVVDPAGREHRILAGDVLAS
jgi:BirA family biotin operon repressor/biotin-[acetyl-CoA-carboxylase] ligase